MRRWLRWGLQLISLALFALLLVWGGPEAWQRVSAGVPRYLVVSFMLFGFASMVSAIRLQSITRSVTGMTPAPWSRFYYLTMTTRALGLVVPRGLSILGGKSVGLVAMGVAAARAVLIVMMDSAFDLVLLGLLVVPGLLYLRRDGSVWLFIIPSVVLILALAGGLLWLAGSGLPQTAMKWLGRHRSLISRLHLDPEGLQQVLVPRSTALQVLGLSILLNGMLGLSYYYIGQAVGLTQSWLVYFAAFPVTQLSLVIAVTPGAVGIFDAGWYGVLLLGGVPRDQALTFVIAQRAYTYVFVLIWAGLSVLLSLAKEGRQHAS